MDEILLALVIFALRVTNYSVGTLRLVAITRNLRLLASALATLEAFVFAVTIANVVTDLGNIINLASYCAGAAVGSYVGMVLEARLITSYAIISFIAQHKGHEVAMALREAGFGVTELRGEGRDGDVSTLRSVVDKRSIVDVIRIARHVNSDVFITIEEARSIQRGWLRTPGREK